MSLRNRLALIFSVIVLAAIAFIYFSVTPRLEGSLRDHKLSQLSKSSRQLQPVLLAKLSAHHSPAEIDDTIKNAAARSSTQILLLSAPTRERGVLSFTKVADSTPSGGLGIDDVQNIAQLAVSVRTTATLTEPTSLGRQALAATPIFVAHKSTVYVVVFGDALADVESSVSLIRRQILISGVLALLMAVAASYLVARALSRRVLRLKDAAGSVAAGDFSNPIREDSDDELGQLADAFADMQGQLARLDTARKQFIAKASHELRTPLFSLGGFLELLEDEELDEKTRQEFIRQLSAQVARLRKLATELLDLSRLESGALELKTSVVDIRKLVENVATEFRPLVGQDGALKVNLPTRALKVECDANRVAQVLRILLDNAITHTPPGTEISLAARRKSHQVQIEVGDKGLGIKRQTLPHIFEPFFTSDDAQGAGLGLTIALELAERMEGDLTVTSVPGKTTFTLVLPNG